ncbi:MAG: sugar transferase [Candidatus Diapherotrites archaeon]|nr:sugar transferase [Candidatus Diapherotrites archaeon]
MPAGKRKHWTSLFRQQRVGKNGKPITITKFRTMWLEPKTKEQPKTSMRVLHTPKDPRLKDKNVMPSKRWLRRFWIDELPQVISLLKGDIRLLGFRPVVSEDFERMPNWMKEKYSNYGPAIIPLYVALKRRPETEDEWRQVYDAFFDGLEKKPRYTNFKYFARFMWNVMQGRVH